MVGFYHWNRSNGQETTTCGKAVIAAHRDTDELPCRKQRGINRNIHSRPKGQGMEPSSALGGFKELQSTSGLNRPEMLRARRKNG